MSAFPRRRQEPDVPPPEGGGTTFFREHRAGLLAIAVAMAAVVAGWLGWRELADRVRADPDSILQPDAVDVIGIAPWIQADVRSEALRDASLDGGLPLDDPELPRRLARAFAIHPWVREVISVKIRHPAAATVEIRCREPVAMVRVPGGMFAVDATGVLLPSKDFSGGSAAPYPRISGITSSPRGTAGFPWEDPLVEEAAAVAAVIGPEWEALGLTDCRPVAAGGQTSWELADDDGLVIRFGSAPGSERAGEPTVAMKLARLRNLAEEGLQGTVDLTEPVDDQDPAAIPAGAP
jgi:hypothetical protein